MGTISPLEDISLGVQVEPAGEQKFRAENQRREDNVMKGTTQNPPEPAFDAKSAKPFRMRVAGSPHHAYKDDRGVICLLCCGSSSGGDVAVNENAIKWLREQTGTLFVRLTHSQSAFEKTILLDELPEKPWRKGNFGGRYAFYGPRDFDPPPAFPPPAVEPPM
jgi:hypothetical protein